MCPLQNPLLAPVTTSLLTTSFSCPPKLYPLFYTSSWGGLATTISPQPHKWVGRLDRRMPACIDVILWSTCTDHYSRYSALIRNLQGVWGSEPIDCGSRHGFSWGSSISFLIKYLDYTTNETSDNAGNNLTAVYLPISCAGCTVCRSAQYRKKNPRLIASWCVVARIIFMTGVYF